MKQLLCIILLIEPRYTLLFLLLFYEYQHRNFYFIVSRYLDPTGPGAFCDGVSSVDCCLYPFSSASPFDYGAGTSTKASASCIDLIAAHVAVVNWVTAVFLVLMLVLHHRLQLKRLIEIVSLSLTCSLRYRFSFVFW